MNAPPVLETVVRCAECASAYRLPHELMGPLGARVTCPACGARFDVAHGTPSERATVIAREIVEELAVRADVMIDAETRGRLFAEAGPSICEAFESYRKRAGSDAPAEAFRAALEARWKLALPGFPGSGP